MNVLRCRTKCITIYNDFRLNYYLQNILRVQLNFKWIKWLNVLQCRIKCITILSSYSMKHYITILDWITTYKTFYEFNEILNELNDWICYNVGQNVLQ